MFPSILVKRLIEDLKNNSKLEGLVWKDLDVAEQRRKPPLIGAFPLEGFVNRTGSLEAMTKYLEDYSGWKSNKGPPMAAVHCRSGGGKTKILSILAGVPDLSGEISSTDEELYKKLRKRLKKYTIVAVTFNNFATNSSPNDKERNPFMALATRALFS